MGWLLGSHTLGYVSNNFYIELSAVFFLKGKSLQKIFVIFLKNTQLNIAWAENFWMGYP